MKNFLVIVIVLVQTACMEGGSDQSQSAPTGPVGSAEDFMAAAGGGWKGHLSYLDYTSESMSKIPVEIEIDEPGGRSLAYSIKYPGEPQYNAREKIKFSRDGRKLDGHLLIARDRSDDGNLILVTAYRGEDNKRPADIRVTYEIGSSEFSIAKEVRFDGERDYFLRNQYSLTREYE